MTEHATSSTSRPDVLDLLTDLAPGPRPSWWHWVKRGDWNIQRDRFLSACFTIAANHEVSP